MPPPVHYTASKLRSIHLLRGLLREASYLPDALARTHIRDLILDRFRKYQVRQDAPALAVAAAATGPEAANRARRNELIEERTAALHGLANKRLNYLRRANQGERGCLERVMHLTYGRLGPRKHKLLAALLELDTSTDEPQPSPFQQAYHSNKRFMQYFDAPEPVPKRPDQMTVPIASRYSKLKAVVKSQVKHGIAMGRGIKGALPVMPRKNIWARPMPVRRARNNVRKWYAMAMTRLLPPLPTDEYNVLEKLATGERRWKGAVKRRIPAKELYPSLDPHAASHAAVDKAITLARPSKADKSFGKERPHNITPRFMQRLYARIIEYCCKLEYDAAQKTWKVLWGTNIGKARQKLKSPTPVPESLFEGVDHQGRLPKSPSYRGRDVLSVSDSAGSRQKLW